MLEIRAYHWTHDVAREMLINPKANLEKVCIGFSHKRLPVDMEFNNSKLNTTAEEVLSRAFDFYNWMTDNRQGQAPDEVNEFCATNGVHASQSVGDIVEIKGEGFWMVDSTGWFKLDAGQILKAF